MDSGSPDVEVVACSVGDSSAFAVLFDRYQADVRRYVARRVGSEVGDDLSSEVFVRAFRARGSCRAAHGSVLPWLLGTANHVIADHRRSEHRRLKALQRLAAAEPQQVEHEDRALSADLVRELRRLSDVDRDALWLMAWGELTFEEVATALGVPVGTVSSRIARARRELTHLKGESGWTYSRP